MHWDWFRPYNDQVALKNAAAATSWEANLQKVQRSAPSGGRWMVASQMSQCLDHVISCSSSHRWGGRRIEIEAYIDGVQSLFHLADVATCWCDGLSWQQLVGGRIFPLFLDAAILEVPITCHLAGGRVWHSGCLSSVCNISWVFFSGCRKTEKTEKVGTPQDTLCSRRRLPCRWRRLPVGIGVG